jgi:hypothetical protein
MEEREQDSVMQRTEERIQCMVATVIEEDRRIEATVQTKLDGLVQLVEAELYLLRERLRALEHDMALSMRSQGKENMPPRRPLQPRENCIACSVDVRTCPAASVPTPIVFCSKLATGSDDDGVRSLLSEEEFVVRGKPLCKATNQSSPLARMAIMFKENFFL